MTNDNFSPSSKGKKDVKRLRLVWVEFVSLLIHPESSDFLSRSAKCLSFNSHQAKTSVAKWSKGDCSLVILETL